MAYSSILSLALVHVILLSNAASATHTASSATPISVLFSKTSAVNSTDDYLLPLSIGTSPQLVYLIPSTSSDDTFVNSPQTCTPPGDLTPLQSCIDYRGSVFTPPHSSSWKSGSSSGSAKFNWKNDGYGLFADGSRGQDTVALSTGVALKGFEFALVDAANVTAAFLGLGRNSTILERLVADGTVGSRSYGLYVGVDLGSGVETGGEMGVRSFPGSLTLGGYDKAKIGNRGVTLQAPISSDGGLGLEVTNVVLVNEWLVSGGVAHDVLNITRNVVIDSSTPYMYLPESAARQLSDVLGAQEGEPGVDFFYGSNANKYIGNLTFTLRAPGGGPSIDIVIPPSVLYQPVTALRDYVPTGDASYSHYLPIKAFQDSSKQPIVLGRTFLKAAYIFVNHDENSFNISQVTYNNSPPNLAAVVTGAGLVFDKSTTVPVTFPDGSPESNGDNHPPIAPIATAVGAGAAMCAFAIAFIVWRRRKSGAQTTLAPLPSSVTVNYYGNERDSNGTAMVTMLPPSRGRDEKDPGGPGQNWGVWEKDGNGGCYMPHPLSAGGGMYYHEMESDQVGMATSPTQAYPPRWTEFPPAHMQHSAHASVQYPPGHRGPVPDSQYEMM